jgi:MarR family transcriptional regulator, organic hydroperoxide resistance regulator
VANDFLRGYLPYLLQRADQLLSDDLHRAMAADGVAVSDWRILAVLRDGLARGVGELAADTMLPQPTCTHAIGRLEASGRVQRQQSADDGRRSVVSLTPSGKRLADRLVKQANDSTDRLLANLDPRLSDELRHHAAALIDALTTEAPST